MGLFVTLGLAWWVGGQLTAPAHRIVGAPPADLHATSFRVDDSDGHAIHGWCVRAPLARAAVLLLHGIRGDRTAMVARAKMLGACDVSTVLIDLHAHGESEGDRITLGASERHGVAAAAAWMGAEFPGAPQFILGVSLGGAAALFAQPLDIDGLILESVYPDIESAIQHRVRARMGPMGALPAWLLLAQLRPRLGIAPDDLRPIDAIARVHCPVLVFSGAADPHTPEAEARRLFAAAPEPKSLWLVPGAAHVDLYRAAPVEYERRLLAFMDSAAIDASTDAEVPTFLRSPGIVDPAPVVPSAEAQGSAFEGLFLFHMAVAEFLLLSIGLSIGPVQTPTSDPAATSVMVVGTPHFWQLGPEKLGGDLSAIQSRVREWKPDHVGVEWLHPSIDPDKTHNYSPLGDAKTLGKLWGLKPADAAEAARRALAVIESSESATEIERIELGKLYYLSGDMLNAGYQWWIADRLGSEDPTYGRLTHDYFRGHELEVLGFDTAFASGVNYITPLDYQGADAEWGGPFDELLEIAAGRGLMAMEGADRGADEYRQKVDDFTSLLVADPSAWTERYGADASLAALGAFVTRQKAHELQIIACAESHPLGVVGGCQEAAFVGEERALYYDGLFHLDFHGRGRQLVVGFERRNHRMIEFLIEDLARRPATKVLIVVGAGHKGPFEEILRGRGFTVVDAGSWLGGGK